MGIQVSGICFMKALHYIKNDGSDFMEISEVGSSYSSVVGTMECESDTSFLDFPGQTEWRYNIKVAFTGLNTTWNLLYTMDHPEISASDMSDLLKYIKDLYTKGSSTK